MASAPCTVSTSTEPNWESSGQPNSPASYLTVQPDGQYVTGIAVVADLRPFLEVVDIHLLWLGMTDHDHKAAGEQTLHDVNIWDFIWAQKESEAAFSLVYGWLVCCDK